MKIIILSLLIFNTFSYACMTKVKLRFGDIVYAEQVFVGTVEKYEIFDQNGTQMFDRTESRLGEYAVITFKIEKNISGADENSTIEVYWSNSTFGIPDMLEEDHYLVSLSGDKQPPLRGPSATIVSSSRPELKTLLQAPCSDPFLLEPNEENIEKAKKLLDGVGSK